MARVFLTGGTGFIGAHIARKLVERGDKVVALVRSSSNTRLLGGLPVELVVGDITDSDSLIKPMSETEQVYHVAADYRLWASDPSNICRINIHGTRNVLEIAKKLEIPKIVYTSTVGCLGLNSDGTPANEETPVSRGDMIGCYKRSKYEAEKIALDYADKGLNIVIVNPSAPVGPGDIKPTPTGKIIVDYLQGKMGGFVDTGLNLIDVRDVAEGHLLAAEHGRVGEKYILGNRNMTLQDILQTLAFITGGKPPTLRIPHWLALIAAVTDTAACGLVGREPGIPVEGVRMSMKKMYFSSEKAVNELGLPQNSVERALTDAVEWFHENGYTNRRSH